MPQFGILEITGRNSPSEPPEREGQAQESTRKKATINTSPAKGRKETPQSVPAPRDLLQKETVQRSWLSIEVLMHAVAWKSLSSSLGWIVDSVHVFLKLCLGVFVSAN